MAALSDSEDDDTFVMIGTPLEPYGEDIPLKKPVAIQDRTVHDEEGRQRFHGAFTGGFSAGYYNTVGTKEGWKPSTFTSSRQDRAGKSQQRPEEFMDDEDLGEFGIAPREVKTTVDFGSDLQRSLKRPTSDDRAVIPGEAILGALVVPAGLSVGVKLLRNLGWREGQGVGPRVKKQRKKKQLPTPTGQKMYGCSLPSPDETSSSEDVVPENVTFAPKDMSPIDFVPKDNLHGLEYSGIIPHTAYPATGGRHKYDRVSSSKGIQGQAFGVGALEDDDGDIYAVSSMSEYDTVLGDTDWDNTHGWTAPRHTAGGMRHTGVKPLLEGFKQLTTQLKTWKVFPPPSIPRGFKSYHKFSQQDEYCIKEAAKIPAKFSLGWRNQDACTRREALGERPEIKSVFDLVSAEGKKKLNEAKSTAEAETSSLGVTVVTSTVRSEVLEQCSGSADSVIPEKPQSRRETSASKDECPAKSVKSPLYTDSLPSYGSFKPFAQDPAKQERYEKYLQYKKQGEQESAAEVWGGQMTEWERQREREEFTRAGQLFRPMSSLMASRFTRPEWHEDDNVQTQKDQVAELTDQDKAAQMKMFGKMTREICEWHPDKVLCKRINVPNPYPESNIVGLLKIKRDKYSVFNFLSLPVDDTEQVKNKVEKPADTTPVKKAAKQRGKPLAILASVDLRVPTHRSSQHSPDPAEHTEDTDTVTTSAEEPERPPVDLFKAIFDDSEEDSKPFSDEDEAKSELEPGNTPPNQEPPSTVPHIFDRFMVTKRDGPEGTFPTPCPEINTSSESEELPEIDKHMDDLQLRLRGDSVVASDDTTDDMYGPVLPPSLPTTSKISTVAPSRSNYHPSKTKKRKEKEKYKHKTKKTKHKKHKHKDKKKKKKKTRNVKISSSESRDSDSSNTDGLSDVLLLQKLRAVKR